MVTRRRRAWADTRFAGVGIATGTENNTDLLLGLAAADVKTITRLVGSLQLTFDPANNSDMHAVCDVGIGVVSREAFDLSTLPDLDAVADYPQQGWVYAATSVVYRSAGPTGLYDLSARFDFDIRAQRKVDRGVLFMSVLQTSITGGFTLTLTGRVRALCLT